MHVASPRVALVTVPPVRVLFRFIPDFPANTPLILEATLREFAAGTRKNDIMNTIAAQLTEDEIKALAAYISGLAP